MKKICFLTVIGIRIYPIYIYIYVYIYDFVCTKTINGI